MARMPVAGDIPSPKIPKAGIIPEEPRWTFSFRYFREIDNFGLRQQQSSWFSSLLVRLNELSNRKISDITSTPGERDAWRYHEINWSQKNIPVQYHDLTWIDESYRGNPEEYPLYQFQVSQALGRVVGFWDEKQVFNIVLLDPMHNIQPSKSHNYKVDSCSPNESEYSGLLLKIQKIVAENSCSSSCPFPSQLNDIHRFNLGAETSILIFPITDVQSASLDNVIEAMGDSSSAIDLLMYAVDEFSK
jgi:hypothetical protein